MSWGPFVKAHFSFFFFIFFNCLAIVSRPGLIFFGFLLALGLEGLEGLVAVAAVVAVVGVGVVAVWGGEGGIALHKTQQPPFRAIVWPMEESTNPAFMQHLGLSSNHSDMICSLFHLYASNKREASQ